MMNELGDQRAVAELDWQEWVESRHYAMSHLG